MHLNGVLEFPEVLDDEGNFIGFDCIIGNPPYIQLQSIEHDADILERMEYETYARTGDIYCLFYEQGMNVLKENGCFVLYYFEQVDESWVW